ncbi:MAG: peroxiredoxin [Spirochaetes bacterium]|nr:peroxiredoxin [Spirochaetota bacterium]
MLSCAKEAEPGRSHREREERGPVSLINRRAPVFSLDAFQGGVIKKISLGDFRGKWLVLYFYPADFTFVCPTELKELADFYPEFKKLGAEIAGVSTDSVYVHRAWHGQNELVKAVTYPMLSDRNGRLSRAFGVYNEDAGTAYRASFVINPDGVIVACEIHDDAIGRSAEELLRKVSAAVTVGKGGGYCPAGWKQGEALIKPQ